MRLQFLGATGTVTGSKYLLEHAGRKLLVDCGLFQGVKQLRLRNWQALPVPAREIDAVVLTHAHIDHSGFLPRLVKLGFRGRVFATGPTKDLCALLLPDSARLMEEEADYANRHGFSRHHPALPLFDEGDALSALERFDARDFDAAFEPAPGFRASFSHAGHILGAASARVEAGGKSVLFSGDLGRADDEMMRPPSPPPRSDWVVIESTYGNRLHPRVDPAQQLAAVISRTAARGGVVLIPSFAVARAQALLHLIARLKEKQLIPNLPVFLNSPMAADVTRLYRRWRQEHRLDDEQCARMCGVARIVNTVQESKSLNDLRVPSVIVSASGMATGGRVVHHLKAYASGERNTIVLPGFQAAGTRGAALAAGADAIKIHGAYVPVRAEVVQLEALSAHADRDGLLAWLGALPAAPRGVFVTHGEPVPADALRLAIEERHGWKVVVPDDRQIVELF